MFRHASTNVWMTLRLSVMIWARRRLQSVHTAARMVPAILHRAMTNATHNAAVALQPAAMMTAPQKDWIASLDVMVHRAHRLASLLARMVLQRNAMPMACRSMSNARRAVMVQPVHRLSANPRAWMALPLNAMRTARPAPADVRMAARGMFVQRKS